MSFLPLSSSPSASWLLRQASGGTERLPGTPIPTTEAARASDEARCPTTLPTPEKRSPWNLEDSGRLSGNGGGLWNGRTRGLGPEGRAAAVIQVDEVEEPAPKSKASVKQATKIKADEPAPAGDELAAEEAAESEVAAVEEVEAEAVEEAAAADDEAAAQTTVAKKKVAKKKVAKKKVVKKKAE